MVNFKAMGFPFKAFRLATAILTCYAITADAAAPSTPKSSQRSQATTISGVLRDVFRDDVDDEFVFLTLEKNNSILFTACMCTNAIQAIKQLNPLVGCFISATGKVINIENLRYNRRMLKTIFSITQPDDLFVVAKPVQSPFDAPSLEESPPTLLEIDFCPPRKISGTVIARWHGDRLLLRKSNGETFRVELRDQELPQINTTIEVVGMVQTDLYRYNLTRAIWRPANDLPPSPDAPPVRTSLRQLNMKNNTRIINTSLPGMTICVRGIVKSTLTGNEGFRNIVLGEDDLSLLVDLSDCPSVATSIQEGSKLQVTGICIMDSESWHPGMIFPKVSGLFLVPRSPADIKILSLPSWWTPPRFLAVLIGMFALLVAAFIWNATLRTLVVRKSRALLKEQALKLSETLKIDERTRLAAELHDFHCQSLTAISYQLSAARNGLYSDPSAAANSLMTAINMLKSCRTDLRRCLWDLRNNVLDYPDFSEAIRATIAPVGKTASISIRFSGSRTLISDTTAHTVLSILRELVSNAVNHGHATKIRIAGERLQQMLRFSVQDDGCGFDISALPGQDKGHFGLDGVKTRLTKIGGKMEIDSAIGAGTYVRFTLYH